MTIEQPFHFDGYRPGVLAALVGLHMDYYARHWSFGRQFETKVAGELAAFLDAYDPMRDLFANAFADDGGLLGSLTIDGRGGTEGGAQLRWFIVADRARGEGLGRRLMERADAFIRERAYRGVSLTTFAGLDAARKLYEEFGFRLDSEIAQDPWSGEVGLQTFVRD